jgi:hypothetical protein
MGRDALIDGAQFRREPILPQQQGPRLFPKAGDVQGRPGLEGRDLSQGVNPTQEAPYPLQDRGVSQFRRAATAARAQGEAVTAMGLEGPPQDGQGRHRRDLPFRQFQGEGVLLQDGRVRPAARAVELGDKGRTLLDADLINPVLVAIEGQQPTIGDQPQGFDRIQDAVGTQIGVGPDIGCHRGCFRFHNSSLSRIRR